MSLSLRPQTPEPGKPGVLRAIALVVLLVATLASLALTVDAGRRNSSMLLVTLFALWVVSPFVGAVLANSISKHWETSARTTLYMVMLIFSLGSVAIYANVVFGPPRPQPAFYFLMTPAASWVLLAINLVLGVVSARKRRFTAAK
jgi:hypothetical protein